MQRDPQPPALPALALVRVIVRKADVLVGRFARGERHDALLQLGERLAFSQDQRVGLGFTGLAVFDGRHLHPDHVARAGLLALQREPIGLLLLHVPQLLVHLAIRHRGHRAGQGEPPRPLQAQFRLDLDQELELDRPLVLEFHIPHRAVEDVGERLGVDRLLPALLHHRFQDRLADGLAVALPDHRGRDLTLAKSREARPAGQIPDRLVFGLLDEVRWHRDRQGLGPRILVGLFDGNLRHGKRNLPPLGAAGEGTGAGTCRPGG